MISQVILTSLVYVFFNVNTVSGYDVAQADQILKDANDVVIACGTPCHDILLAECMDAPDTGDPVCACDTTEKHYRNITLAGQKCIRHHHIHETCSTEHGRCIDRYTQCTKEMSFNDVWKCHCSHGTESMRITHQQLACGVPKKGEECDPCTANGGTCYEYFDEGIGANRTHCNCPGSTSGEHCQTIHATIVCKDETMFVCYNEHPEYDNSAGTWIEADGMGLQHASCKGHLVGEGDPICPAGELKLTLPLDEVQRQLCGTRKILIKDEWIKYVSLVSAHKDENSHMEGDIITFETFCQVQSHVMTVLGGISQVDQVDDTLARTTYPDLTMEVIDILNNPISSNNPAELEERVKIRISLDSASPYNMFLVESCLFSTHSDYRRTDAVTEIVIQEGCTVPGQTFMPFSFNRNSHTQTTNYFEVQPLATEMNLYVHCLVKACMDAESATCAQPDCSKRRRRAADEDDIGEIDLIDKVKDVELTQGIAFAEPTKKLEMNQIIANKGTFITALCVILFVVAIVIVIVVVFSVRYWRRRQHDKNKLVVPERAEGTGYPARVHPSHTVNKGFVPEEMRSYASHNVL